MGFYPFLAALLLDLQNKGQPSDKKQHDSVQPAAAPLQSAANYSPADLPATVSTLQQQLPPQSPLIQEVTEVVKPSHVETVQHEGQQPQVAGQASVQVGQEDGESEQDCVRLFGSRLQALEASSRRMERKVDQILEYCRTLAQAMSPA